MARQITNHGLIAVNGKKLDVPSYRVRVGDIITVKETAKQKTLFNKISEKLAKIEATLEKEESVIFYFDRENSHKDLLELQDYFEAKGKSFYMSEVKYGLSDSEYMYQVHIIN